MDDRHFRAPLGDRPRLGAALIYELASIPSLLYLVLMQWALVAAGLALAWREERSLRAASWAMSSLAPLMLVGAWWALMQLPDATLGWWRVPFDLIVLGVLCCWARVAWLRSAQPDAATAEPRRRALDKWSALTGQLHLLIFAVSSVWFAHWFLLSGGLRFEGLPWPGWWLALTIVANRLMGALLLGLLAHGGVKSLAGDWIEADRLDWLAAIGQAVVWVAGWRLIAMMASVGMGMLADPVGPRYFLRALLGSGFTVASVRVLLGTLLPALLGWRATLLAEAGKASAARQMFLPALIMAAIAEALGAGLTFGMLGFGF